MSLYLYLYEELNVQRCFRAIRKMSDQFLGCTVSIKCNNSKAYQGQIADITEDCVTLTKAFCNGVPHPYPIVVLR